MKFYMLHPKRIDEMVKKEHAIVIDVRERTSYQNFHYPGAYNYPYEEIGRWAGRLPKNRKLILYCEYGSTSLLAARRLSREGYTVYTVNGGIQGIRS